MMFQNTCLWAPALALVVGIAACKPHHGGTDSDSDDSATSDPGCVPETLEGDITITDSTDRSAFHCVTEITGDLTIWSVSGLEDLNDFMNLERVGGTLSVRDNSSLETLAGLERLEAVGDRLEIEVNSQLKDVSVPSLASAQYVSISTNPELTTLAGLGAQTWSTRPAWVAIVDNESLTSVAGLSALLSETTNVSLLANPALENLAGLESVVALGRLNLEDLDSLSNLNELAQLRDVEVLRIGGNDGLMSLAGLGNLETVDYLTLGDCAIELETNNLSNFEGLESLKSVQHLEISRHNDLTSLAALNVLAGTAIDTLVITRNPQLSQAEIDAFTSAVTIANLGEICQNRDDDVACLCGGETG